MKYLENKISGSTVIRSACINESGAVLVIGLMFIAILGLLGSTAVVLTTTDMKIGANYRAGVQAFNAGQAGLEEARQRLKGTSSTLNFVGDTSADPFWTAYITANSSTATDPDNGNTYYTNTITHNSLQSDISYLVRIRHKTEYEAEEAGHTTGTPHYNDGDGSPSTHNATSPGNIVYYGDDPATPNTAEWVDFTMSGTPSATVAKPIELVCAYGSKNGGLSTIEIAIKGAPLDIDADAVLYAKDNVTGNGSALSVNAVGPTGCGSVTDTIYTYSTPTAPTTTTLNGSPTLIPGPPNSGNHNVEITDIIDSMYKNANEVITSDQNGTTYGSSANFQTYYSDTSNPYNVQGLKLQQVTGWGLLMVEGDLELGGGFTWKGLILVTGVLAFNGGGGPNAINIEGAVMANQTVAINGSINLQYNACYISNALGSVSPKIASWKEVY